MDVLNTYGGETSTFTLILAVICGLLALFFFVGAVLTEEPLAIIVAILFAVLALALWSNASEQVRHEVTLRPDGVIDARKYEIIEQRGAIYVIEERKIAQEKVAE
ncbi:hypothetical protein [Paenibacillus sp. FSL K6-2859]|uniref:hypothetical protein n=1 Tax=Paenibacillus sp. FSL K6-2859 TaxID=2921482 RepID=UPI0030F73936